jgi:hypothetical protein
MPPSSKSTSRSGLSTAVLTVLPFAILSTHTNSARTVTVCGRRLLIGKEHAMRAVTTGCERAQGAGAVEPTVDPATTVPTEPSWLG